MIHYILHKLEYTEGWFPKNKKVVFKDYAINVVLQWEA